MSFDHFILQHLYPIPYLGEFSRANFKTNVFFANRRLEGDFIKAEGKFFSSDLLWGLRIVVSLKDDFYFLFWKSFGQQIEGNLNLFGLKGAQREKDYCGGLLWGRFSFYFQNEELWHGVSEERANGIDHQRLVMVNLDGYPEMQPYS